MSQSTVQPTEHTHALRSGVLGAADTAMMAVAGSAPAYSIAASTATLVAVAGLASPAALLYCGIPMLGIAWAFSHLGRTEVNAGASYAWVGRALHPALGFLPGRSRSRCSIPILPTTPRWSPWSGPSGSR
jgi:amino acid transporter